MIGGLGGAYRSFSGIKLALGLAAVAVPFAIALSKCASDVHSRMFEAGGDRVRAVVARETANVLEERSRASRARTQAAIADRDRARLRVAAAERRIGDLLTRPSATLPVLEEDGELEQCPANCRLR